MYCLSYSEILEESPSELRSQERTVFERAIQLLSIAKDKGPKSSESEDALAFLQRLWMFLIEDLLNPENGLPKELRAQLVSIGIWSMREADMIRDGLSDNYRSLIDINSMIRDGL